MGPTIYLDMDGVCVDFVYAVSRIFNRPDFLSSKKQESWLPKRLGISDAEFWARIEQEDGGQHVFWSSLRPYPWFRRLYGELSDLAPVCFLSKPTLDPDSASGKLEWLRDRFGDGFEEYILTPQKYHVARPGAILIDDQDDNIEEWIIAGGTGILFPQPWNSSRRRPTYDKHKVDDVLREVEDCISASLSVDT